MSNPNNKLRNNPYTAPQFYYPLNLGEEGQEPYVIIDIRDSVAKDPKSKGTIALPIPQELRTTYRAEYEEESMAIFGGANPSIPKNPWSSIKDGAAEFGRNPISSSKRAFETLGDETVGTIYGTAVNAVSRAQRDFKTIVNPHMAVLFRGIPMRTFPMSWNLVARNIEESNMIRNLIYTFKYHMHPALPENAGRNRFLLYPENFVLAFYSPSSEYLFNTSPCVLETMDVNYNGSGVPSFYSDTGAPVHINISLSFKETEELTKERIATGA